MKKFIVIIFIIISCFSLCSCPYFGEVITHPNMVEYEEQEIIDKAKEKYSFSKVILKNKETFGKKEYDENGKLLIDKISPVKIFNGDNIEKAFTSFAGINGGRNTQFRYERFICYYGLGQKDDGSFLFFFYNLNLDKDANVFDTIGMSEYGYDISPYELTNEKISIPDGLKEIAYDIRKAKFYYNYLNYDMDRLSYKSTISYYLGKSEFVSYRIEFYKVDNKIEYDLFLINDELDEKLIYSTSNKYSFIEYKYGMDINEYFDMQMQIEETDDNVNYICKSKLKAVDGNILYSSFNYVLKIEEKREENLNTTYQEGFNVYTYDKVFEKNYSIKRYDINNYQDISLFTLWHFYVFYEKNNL